MEFYVYQYLDESGNPYYIGKGKGKRIHRMHTKTVLPPVERRVVIQDGLTNEEAKQLEKELITKYGRKIDGGILDNIKINQWACAVGWKHSEEAKLKISKGNKGKVRTEKHRANYRKPKTADHAEKIRQANLGRPYDPVRAAKISATLKGRKLSPEAIAKREATKLRKRQEKLNG
jgi:NUMOD3 motif